MKEINDLEPIVQKLCGQVIQADGDLHGIIVSHPYVQAGRVDKEKFHSLKRGQNDVLKPALGHVVNLIFIPPVPDVSVGAYFIYPGGFNGLAQG